MNIHVVDIGHIIQLSVGPVFLLSGVGITLTVLTNRLARIVDRARRLEERLAAAPGVDGDDTHIELRTLFHRATLINRAITLSTICALLVCLVVVTLFLADALNLDLSMFVALLFVTGMLSFIGAFLFFLREIFLATATLRIGVHYTGGR